MFDSIANTELVCAPLQRMVKKMGRQQKPVVENSLGGRVRLLRKQKGWNQTQLAIAAGVAQQTVSFIENNKTYQPRELVKIAKALDSTPAWLQFGVKEIDQLDSDSITLALSWQALDEPLKTSIRQLIQNAGKSHEKPKK